MVQIQFFQASPSGSEMKAGAQFGTKGVSETIQCQANKPKMTHKEIHTADLHSDTSAETWGTSLASRGRSRSGVRVKLADHDFLIDDEKLFITQTSHVVPEFSPLSQIISMTLLPLLLIP